MIIICIRMSMSFRFAADANPVVTETTRTILESPCTETLHLPAAPGLPCCYSAHRWPLAPRKRRTSSIP
ncbi:hypothetical protein PSEUDO9AZ_40024 [Pseudomonas sp. 9AZ]|nr:hypothetical protein PSEUDO9AZ_40024 [Pseudomonas sp. 9AZ]